MKVHVGTAPDNWGVWFPDDPRQTPWDRYLDEVVEAGYDLTELGPFGYLPSTPEKLKPELENRGLKLAGGFTFGDMSNPKECWDDLERQTIGSCELSTALGAEYHLLISVPYTDLFTGELIGVPRLEGDAWKVFIETNHRLATIVRDRYKLKCVFHGHAETHVEYPDQHEQYLEDTDPDLISLCLDTGHFAYRGGDSVAFMKEHHKRIPYLHLKSVDPIMQKRIKDENIPFAIAVGQDLFCEPSKGVVDFEAFRDVLYEVNYEGVGIVEQDLYPCDFDRPLPIAKRTRQYLKDIGIG
jgi:inosose dehydratase